VIWAKLVAGRANAALRSAEGIRAAIAVSFDVIRKGLVQWMFVWACGWLVVCCSGQVPTMEMEMELEWSAPVD
jgi:hypothetical protein